ncbi:MAG TPA: LD-carboxypeptidase [Kofleriaceae bacterium]|jgi:muramoyltetrapeptide carboxypeptidase
MTIAPGPAALATIAIPPRIRRGETLGIVAPGGPVKPNRFATGIARLGDTFRLRVADSVLAAHPDGVPSYLAATDDQRVAELSAMIADPDVRAIVLARGGYGMMRILPKLDPAALVRDPKPIVGFSDATALLAWAYAAGVRGIHGPMIEQLTDLSDADVAHLIAMLTEPRAAGVRPWRLEAHGSGSLRGPLIAGNLTLFSMLAGTPWRLPLDGALALIEEIGEKPYELDRYLTQLMLVGELAKPRAMIVGDLVRCVDPGQPDSSDAALQTIGERLRAAKLPSAVGAPIGHGHRNEAVPFGGDAILDLDAGTLELVDAAVA